MVLMGTACGDGESDPTVGLGSCSDVVEIRGEEWSSLLLKEALAMDATTGPEVAATQQPCDDLRAPDENAEEGTGTASTVRLLRIVDVPAHTALFDPTKPDYVYVQARDDELDTLPQTVGDLLKPG